MRSLSDHEQECLGLTVAEMKKNIKKKKEESHHWTGVVSTAHFTMIGCHDIPLTEDTSDAWAHIEAAHQEGVLLWDFIFNAKEHELPDSATDIEPHRLSAKVLEDLGYKVTRLRNQADERASLINYQGDAADAPRQPPRHNEKELKEQTRHRKVKYLAKDQFQIILHYLD